MVVTMMILGGRIAGKGRKTLGVTSTNMRRNTVRGDDLLMCASSCKMTNLPLNRYIQQFSVTLRVGI